ncbi:MAG: 30S ribosomal protein S15 [Verrucomicrobiales bacterium]|nr:30S ribosomal protein S15 [Verrucomicrobiales bacterium]|tara:strand:+ start:2324 stop:2584 length:261 start_codon:yes stop_codon:yes gene_type:complete
MEVRSKAEAIKNFQRNESDTGSTEVQIAILSKRIKHLEKHLAQNKKDHSTRRGLLNMVSYRKRLLKYLQRKDLNKFTEVKKELGIR